MVRSFTPEDSVTLRCVALRSTIRLILCDSSPTVSERIAFSGIILSAISKFFKTEAALNFKFRARKIKSCGAVVTLSRRFFWTFNHTFACGSETSSKISRLSALNNACLPTNNFLMLQSPKISASIVSAFTSFTSNFAALTVSNDKLSILLFNKILSPIK